ncbi:Hypothetical protein CINCED_3A014336 [Cinara cedri]|uniref:Uncharacterized protein n=1 Tax=Cinara cedri TaxID=506608 RepID=A0A5E4MJD7_9HEMI|nr:Hypothetical protein CINCED_3A014336 [Cinara cedri]
MIDLLVAKFVFITDESKKQTNDCHSRLTMNSGCSSVGFGYEDPLRPYGNVKKPKLSEELSFPNTSVQNVGVGELPSPSSMDAIKTKNRSQLMNLENDMRLCLSAIRSRIKLIMKGNQAQISH